MNPIRIALVVLSLACFAAATLLRHVRATGDRGRLFEAKVVVRAK